MRVVDRRTGKVVAQLSDDWRTTKGSLRIPKMVPLQMSRQYGQLIEELAIPIGRDHQQYQEALEDWLLYQGLELRE